MAAIIGRSQANFTRGQLGPRMYSRIDYDGYYKGARVLKNCITLPQGGAKRRFGTNYLIDLDDLVTDDSDVKLIILEYDAITNYVVILTPLLLKVYKGKTLLYYTDTIYMQPDISALKWTQSDGVLTIVNTNYVPMLLARDVNDETMWTFTNAVFKNMPTYDFSQDYDAINFTPSAASGNAVTITASAPIFTADDVGGIFAGNGGTLRIKTFTDSTHVVGYTITEFLNTGTIIGSEALLAEPVWSDTKGWPICATFFQGRQVFGGTKLLPFFLTLSTPNDFYNFDDSEALDDNAISVFVKGDRSAVIQNLLGAATLILFTSTGVFNVGTSAGNAITPTNISVTENIKGVTQDVRPCFIDNQAFYVAGKQLIRALNFDFLKLSYQASNVSVLTDVVKDTRFMDVYNNPDVDDGNLVFTVNMDGTLAIFSTLTEQQISGWSWHELGTGEVDTDTLERRQKFVQLCGAYDDMYFIVKRKYSEDDSFHYSVEQLNFNIYIDNATTFDFGSPTSVINESDLPAHFLNANIEEIFIINNYSIIPFTISGDEGDRVLNLKYPVSSCVVGYNYYPEIVPMPISIETQSGPDLYSPKRIVHIYVDYLDSYGIYVNDDLLPPQKMPLNLNDPLELMSGFQEVFPLTDYDPFYYIIITQNEPYPMIIRGLELNVLISTGQP